MKHSDFKMGMEFTMNDKLWRVTDIGSRTIIAIRLSDLIVDGTKGKRELGKAKAEAKGWFNGPPYAVTEWALDEDDLPVCEPIK